MRKKNGNERDQKYIRTSNNIICIIQKHRTTIFLYRNVDHREYIVCLYTINYNNITEDMLHIASVLLSRR